MTIDDILTGPQKVKYGRYDLQLPTLGRSIEAQDQNSKDARCIAMTMARTQVVFQESLHMRLSCKPHPLCRWPELLQRLWTVTVNGVWTRDRCSVFYNTWYLGASGVSYVKRRAKITSTNEGDRCQSECATITFLELECLCNTGQFPEDLPNWAEDRNDLHNVSRSRFPRNPVR